ncbi:MAG: GspE/PulE family protein [Erysipelotrichaceae bacterium]
MQVKMKIGELLIDSGFITQKQLDDAISYQKNNRSKRLGEILLELGYVNEKQLLSVLGKKLNIPVVELNMIKVDVNVVELVPKDICQKNNIVAIEIINDRVVLAINDPLDFYAIEDVKSLLNYQSDLVLARKADIQATIDRYYGEIEAKKASQSIAPNEFSIIDNVDEGMKDSPIVKLVNSVIYKAYMDHASDIHFEPFEKQLVIRIRVDGQLIDYMKLDVHAALQVTTRIKVMSSLDIAEKRIPQDGHFKIKKDDGDINIRVSSMPTVFGEKLVLRFLNSDVKVDNDNHYGMSEDNYNKIERILSKPYGIVYITGPTGSGKTTTLYMMIDKMAKKNINISTIEDPVERTLERVNQVQVNNLAGMTFERGLRSMLRQDPDVILVGETRDKETANISVNAAITGHLVLSTLHTNDAVSSVARLYNMGVEHYLIASSLIGVVAQRLVKKVCPHCKEEYLSTSEDRKIVPNAYRLTRGKGCPACNHTGYLGRIAVHEILEIDKNVRSMIENKAPSEDIYHYLQDNNLLVSISEEIKELVINGVTTIDELKHHLIKY